MLCALGISPEVVHTALSVSAKIELISGFNVKAVRAAKEMRDVIEGRGRKVNRSVSPDDDSAV